jgi:mRNA interferase MazF
VVVVAITSDLRLGGAPGNVELASDDSGLSKHSVINVSQIATLDESQLSDVIGTVEREVMRRVETGMARVLELSS